MKEYIDKYERCKNCYHFSSCDAWVKHGTTLYDDYDFSVEDCPYYIPTTDVEEIRHGEWVKETEYYADDYSECNVRKVYACSLCGRTEKHKEPYCNCGAKMS